MAYFGGMFFFCESAGWGWSQLFSWLLHCSGDTKADKKKKTQKSSPELRGLVLVCFSKVFSRSSRELSAVFFPFIGFWGIQIAISAFQTLRAKGTLMSEPRYSTPCDMRSFPRDKGKMASLEGFAFSLYRVEKIACCRG